MAQLRENLLVRFSVISFIVMALLATLLITLLSTKVRSAAVANAIDEAVGTASGRLLQVLSPADLEQPMTGERYDQMHEYVQRYIVSERTARVKIWAKDGTVIYSNDPLSVGDIFPDNENVHKALAGQTPYEIKIPDDLENARERDLGTLMEVYAPIYFPGTQTAQGVFEFYQYYAPTARYIGELGVWVLGTIGIGFAILYLSLVSIVRRGWQTIQSQRSRLYQMNEELHQQVEMLNQEVGVRKRAEATLRLYTARLEQSNRDLQDFAYVSSHDLQEPLRKVRAFGDRLRSRYGDRLDDQGRDYLERMQNAAARMQILIEALLTYSRLTTCAEPFVQVDLGQIVQEVIGDLEMRIEQVQGRVEVAQLPVVQADPIQMRQLFQNLIGNALKFHYKDRPPVVKVYSTSLNPGGGHVNGSASTAEFCQICVEDNGIGFDEKYVDRIFQVFQRLHGRNEFEGTGTGLAICRKIIERHGGTITARSQPEQGATFVITLPVMEQDKNKETGDEQWLQTADYHLNGR
jgi:signal transduction histidine kinase